ncbi:MAG: hypothetical protein HY721_19295 [Planctomycetes bacterium]|nr:hypothetical protein [Planctomycetota bacterium]
MVTRDVTIKAIVRLGTDVAAAWGKQIEPGEDSSDLLAKRFAPLEAIAGEFRRDGFYERFPARGQAERVEKIRRRLARELGIARGEAEKAE